jgi:hypothetical protein
MYPLNVASKNTEDINPEEEKLEFNSLEEMTEHFDKLIAKEQQEWGILYPIKFGVECLIYRSKKLKNEIIWTFQRITRKHHAADVDLWSLDFHIAKILLPKLEMFRNQRFHSYPPTFNSPAHCVLEEVTGIQDKHGNTNEGLQNWYNILDEIIYAFRWNVYANWEKNTKKERAFYLHYFGQDIPNLDYHYYYGFELVKKAADRAQKGFELFGKYFTCLWD